MRLLLSLILCAPALAAIAAPPPANEPHGPPDFAPALAPVADRPVSFTNEVMAVVSKAGCNAGACHGNKSGKGGLKLSLRGQDPETDYDVLTRDQLGRRTNLLEPERSLILLKPAGQLAHEGGKRFETDSPEYGILRRWIEQGTPRDPPATPALRRLEVTPAAAVLVTPADRLQIHATAVFSDGTRRDAGRLAVYEQSADLASISVDGLVRRRRDGETTVIVRYLNQQEPVRLCFVPARTDFVADSTPANNFIDEHVFAKLRTLRMNPSGPCTDGEYARRAYLDLLGVLPTADEARAFVADLSPGKRPRLVESLLDRPEFADFWAVKWCDLLRVEERTLDRKGVQAFHHWVRQGIAENKPLDQFARDLLAARGSTYANPPANFYRAMRDPATRGESTAQLFLGVRLQCAQCHNHPFDRWTQDDYFGWADVFGRVSYKVLENRRRDPNDSHEFIGEQVVYEASEGDIKDPRGDRPVRPRMLGALAPLAEPGAGDVAGEPAAKGEGRLDALAAWVTSPANPFFARAQANRVWANLMGRGLVDPVDDFRPTNPPSHPELLDALAADFRAHGYDIRYLIRLIMGSRAYALSAEPNATNAEDATNYSHALPRRLTAEQLLDAQHQVLGVASEFAGYPRGTRAGQIPGVRAARPRGQSPTAADNFLITFGKPPRLIACDCERSGETTLGQTFQLIAGPELARLLAAPDNRLSARMKAGESDARIIDDLYWAALSRPPSEAERQAMTAYVRRSPDRRRGLEDVAWAVLNAKEFVLRR